MESGSAGRNLVLRQRWTINSPGMMKSMVLLELAAEGGEFAVGFGADFDRRAGERGVALGVDVDVVKLFGGGGEVVGLFDGFQHGFSFFGFGWRAI